MTSFYNGENHLLQTVCISEAMCDELQETKSSWYNEKVVMVACHGEPIGRFLTILLSQGSSCAYLNLGLMNRLALEAWTTIGAALKNSTRLDHLVIGFTDLPLHAMKGLASGFGQAQNLHQLHLNDMAWEEDDDGDLAAALKSNSKLRVLSVSACGLTDERVAQLVRAVKGHPKLQELRLSGNKYSQETSEALADLLRQPNSSLQEIYLDNERYQTKRRRAKLDMTAIASALTHNTTLKTLDLSDNLLNDQDFESLMEALVPGEVHNTTLERLVLARNRITDFGFAKFLKEVLPRIRGLKSLALWGNLMEDTTIRKRHTTSNPKVLCNRAIKAMMDLEDVELLKVVARPEGIPLGLWPICLHRAQTIQAAKNQEEKATIAKSANVLFLMLRGPMMMSAFASANNHNK